MKRQFEEKKPKGQAIGKFPLPRGGENWRLTLAGGKTDRRVKSGIQAGGNPLLPKIAFDLKERLAGGKATPLRAVETQLRLVGQLLRCHAPRFGVLDGNGQAALPIGHPIGGTMVPLGIHHRLGKSPYLPLQILCQTAGVHTRVMMMVIRPRNHRMVMNNDLESEKIQ